MRLGSYDCQKKPDEKSNLNCLQDRFQCRIKSSSDDTVGLIMPGFLYKMYSSLQKTLTSLKWTFVISYKTLRQKTNGYTSVPNLLQNSFNAHCTPHLCNRKSITP